MKLLKMLLIGFGICSCALLSGCITADSTEMRLVLNEDLSGKMILSATNISSDHEDVKSQRKEMREFYEEAVAECIKELREQGFKDVTSDIYNRTRLKCDGMIRARFDHIMSALSRFSSADDPDAQHEFVTSPGRFSVRISAKVFSTKDREYFAIRYDSGIIEHNAHQYDPATHTIRWNLKNAAKDGIYFVLQMPSSP